MPSISKLQVASELLDRGLRLYFENDSYFAALHLAGAAEEILAVYVKSLGGDSSHDKLKAAAVRFSNYLRADGREADPNAIGSLINDPKNSTKHKRGKGDNDVDFDPKAEAYLMLSLAVENYYELMSSHGLKDTDLMRRLTTEGRRGPNPPINRTVPGEPGPAGYRQR